jgi:hypothetical protein
VSVSDEVSKLAELSHGAEDQILGDEFTIAEVLEVIRGLPWGKAAGLDGIPNEFFKLGGDSMAKAITKLFNWLVALEKLPRSWGRSLVATIYKKGDNTDPGNYRGISLISCMGKLFTRLADRRIRK